MGIIHGDIALVINIGLRLMLMHATTKENELGSSTTHPIPPILKYMIFFRVH